MADAGVAIVWICYELYHPHYVTFIAASFSDDGVQIRRDIQPHSSICYYKGVNGYAELYNAISVTTATIGTSTYAIVTSFDDDGIQIVKLEQEYISAYTSNQNPKYAKAGDAFEISFTASDTIVSQTSQILGLNPNATVNDAIYNAIVPVPSSTKRIICYIYNQSCKRQWYKRNCN